MTRDEIVTALRCHCDAIETGVCPKDIDHQLHASRRWREV